jgi:anaerobic nitric oxide reductase transcription regulator
VSRTISLPDSATLVDSRGETSGWLVVLHAPNKPAIGACASIRDGDVHLGRDGLAGIDLGDSALSRRHLAVGWVAGIPTLVDLNSKNGTYVQGAKVPAMSNRGLEDGDVIRCGQSVIGFSADEPGPRFDLDDVVPGRAPAAVGARAWLANVARTDHHVYIAGETGSGKEAIARWLHQHSPRAKRPYVSVNCASLDESLGEAKLVGNEKGAYTGASDARKGLFHVAHGGTLFLDEVQAMIPSLQDYLLRFAEDGRFRTLGASDREVEVSVRLVAASSEPVGLMSQSLRRPLLARLQRLDPVVLPPLRERRIDILDWARHFLAEAHLRSRGRTTVEFDAGFAEALLLCPWDTNLRGLRGAVDSAVLRAGRASTLKASDLSDQVQSHRSSLRAEGPVGASPPTAEERRSAPPGLSEEDRERWLECFDALSRHDGRVASAAPELGTSERQLRRELVRLGIEHRGFFRRGRAV